MQNIAKKGFTLIELLVVITIIGILATGAVQVFTSQIQKARDTTRISDVTALRGGIEQYYQDESAYPNNTVVADFNGATNSVAVYVPKLPSDPKSGESSNGSIFDYAYIAGPDSNGIDLQEFEVSTHFENSGNLTGKAATDGGNDNTRLELGIDTSGNNTTFTGTIVDFPGNTLTCAGPTGASITCAAGTPIIIKGN